MTALRTMLRRNAITWFRVRSQQFAAASLALIALLATAPALAEPPGASAKSFFLVASRNMPDPVFQQSVILMLPSDEPPLGSPPGELVTCRKLELSQHGRDVGFDGLR